MSDSRIPAEARLGAGGFTRVQTRRGFEYISEQIRKAIGDGTYKPGERLPPERQLAEIFGVSRQGVREALRGLEASGLVSSRPGAGGGVFVREGDKIEARPVEIGEMDARHAEVKAGLEPGEQYAAENSFVVKAEIGKGEAEHGH